MAMNYEFERHIKAAQEANNAQGVKALRSLQVHYEILALNGIVPVLQRESDKTKEIAPVLPKRQAETDIKESSELPSGMLFPRLLEFFRIQANLQQKQLAALANVDPSLISRFERGVYKTPKPNTIMKICAGFGWTPEDPRANLLAEKADEMRREARRKS